MLDSNSIYFIASGAFITLKYSILSVLFGMILGIVVALMRVTQNCF